MIGGTFSTYVTLLSEKLLVHYFNSKQQDQNAIQVENHGVAIEHPICIHNIKRNRKKKYLVD
jgi:hypothetical protein